MSHTDPDITAVRQLPPGTLEPTDESVSRTWYRLTARRTQRHRPRSPQRLLIPAAAGAVVVGLVIGAAVLLAPGNGGPALQPGAVPVLGVPTDVKTEMDRLIRAAERIEPLPLSDGELIYVHNEGVSTLLHGAGDSGVLEAEKHQMWLDPQGMIPLRIIRNGKDFTKDTENDHAAEVAQARQQLTADGPSLLRPTPQWLADLPTDPAVLRAQLLAAIGENSWSEEHRLVNGLVDLFVRVEPVLTPPVRVAFYRLLGDIDGTTAMEITVEGRVLVAIRHEENGSATDLLFDPLTGRSAGRRSAVSSDDVRISPAPGVDPATFDPTVLSQSIWTHTIVSKVGQTR
ncbi:MAG TPA: CU044_5270 family protein [Micromonosporaceae bacterium]|nr:CU044_5270 family protein [Micromonosporaceae bacterium]